MAAESTGDAGRFTAPPCRYSMTCASALQIVGALVPSKPIVGELRGCCARQERECTDVVGIVLHGMSPHGQSCLNGLLKNLDPLIPYRQGNSAAFVIPIRTPLAISGAAPRA
jgi:hypothetical protein